MDRRAEHRPVQNLLEVDVPLWSVAARPAPENGQTAGRSVRLRSVLTMAAEPMARVFKMALGKISLALGIHCCTNILYFVCPTSVSVL